jgi:hypothetical protein
VQPDRDPLNANGDTIAATILQRLGFISSVASPMDKNAVRERAEPVAEQT